MADHVATFAPSSGPERAGKYDVFPPFARGGMASVHVGRLRGPHGFSKLVAVKRLGPAFARSDRHRRMLFEEARVSTRIANPHVVSVLDLVAEKDEVWLVMELVRGVSLSTLLRCAGEQGARVPLPVVSAVMCDTLRGLHAAHEATDAQGKSLGIVHRDVSPQNILVGADGVAKVADFGIAKAVGTQGLTVTGEIKGKLGYMSPEQLRGAAVTRQSDLFSAGVVLWEALVGERLGADRVEGACLPAPSTRVHGLAPAVDEVTRVALAHEERARYANAEVMALALEEACPPASRRDVIAFVERFAFDDLERLADAIRVAEQAPATGGVTPSGRRRAGRVVVALSLALAAVVAAAAALRGHVRAPESGASSATPPAPPAPDTAASTSPIAPPASAETSVAATRAAPAAPRMRAPHSAKRPADPCNPPFTYDDAGKKHYILGCVP